MNPRSKNENLEFRKLTEEISQAEGFSIGPFLVISLRLDLVVVPAQRVPNCVILVSFSGVGEKNKKRRDEKEEKGKFVVSLLIHSHLKNKKKMKKEKLWKKTSVRCFFISFCIFHYCCYDIPWNKGLQYGCGNYSRSAIL